MKKLKVADEEGNSRIIWREIQRSRDSRYDHRLHGILAVCRGLSCYKTAAIWGASPRSVEYWVRRFSEEGLSGLQERRRPGRPPVLSEAQKDLLRSDLERGPTDVGLDQPRWSGKLLKTYLAEFYGVRMGVRQCQRLIRRRERAKVDALVVRKY